MNPIHMTWLDLYNFLYQRANDVKNLGKFDWQAAVQVYDNQHGGLYHADLIQMYDQDIKKEIYIQIDSGDN